MRITTSMTKELRKRLGVGITVAHELLVLSGGDVDLAEKCSRESQGLDQCKAAIIDARFRRLEDECEYNHETLTGFTESMQERWANGGW